LYSYTVFIESVEFGYSYEDPETMDTVSNTKLQNISISNSWALLLETFSLPEVDTDISLVIKINYRYSGLEMPEDGFVFLINGLSLGQSSEEFQAKSLGVRLQTITENIAIDQTRGIEAKAYGLQDLSGYYLGNDSKLFAKNSGMPMVYGASIITIIVPNNNETSLFIT
jgi:hypothetical protein